MKNIRFLKKLVVISIFLSFLLISSHVHSQGNNHVNSRNNNLNGLCVDLTRGNGIAQVLQQILVLQTQFEVLLQETLDNQKDASEDLEKIVEDLENIATILGVNCP